MSKRILHIEGKNLVDLEYTEGTPVSLLDGDVYVFDDIELRKLYIWIGQDSSVEESTVGAWLTNKIDVEQYDGEPDVYTIKQGEEPDMLTSRFEFKVVDGDTPGFLRRAKLDMVEYKLFHVFTEGETLLLDKAKVEEVPLSRSSLTSGDVYVLDGNENLYCWIGKDAAIEEKHAGQKLMQTIDSGRNYLPLQFTIYEGEGGKSEEAFYQLIERLRGLGSAVSVEDQRELQYRPETALSAEEGKAKVNAEFRDARPDEIRRPAASGSDQAALKGVITEDLPEKGSVAARIAAINAKADDTPKQVTKPVAETKQAPATKQAEPAAMKVAPVEEEPTPVSVSERVHAIDAKTDDGSAASKPSQDDSSPVGVSARIAAINERVETYGSTKETDAKHEFHSSGECVASPMHETVWAAGKECSVCGRGPPCPAADMHKVVWAAGKECSICHRRG